MLIPLRWSLGGRRSIHHQIFQSQVTSCRMLVCQGARVLSRTLNIVLLIVVAIDTIIEMQIILGGRVKNRLGPLVW